MLIVSAESWFLFREIRILYMIGPFLSFFNYQYTHFMLYVDFKFMTFVSWLQVSWLDFTDISKGKEQHAIPVFCPVAGPCPMMEFSYVTKSAFSEHVVLDDGLESRCACTIRNCLLESAGCICAVKNGGRFAYSADGRLAAHMLCQVRRGLSLSKLHHQIPSQLSQFYK